MEVGFFCDYQKIVEIYQWINQGTNLHHFKGLLNILFCLLPLFSWGQDYLVHLQHLTTRDGLASASVVDIKQDSKGFTWMITRDGVNRFDSESFRLYTRASHGLRFNKYDRILIDSKGNIWLVHGKIAIDQQIQGMDEVEVDILDPVTEMVYAFDQYVNHQIRESDLFFLQQREDYTISIGDNHGNAYIFGEELEHLFFLPDKPMSFFKTQDGLFWINRGGALLLQDSCMIPLNEVVLPISTQWLGELKDGTLLLQDRYGVGPELTDKNYWSIYAIKKNGGLALQKIYWDRHPLYGTSSSHYTFFLDREKRLWMTSQQEKQLYIFEWTEEEKFNLDHPMLKVDLPFEATHLYFDRNNLAWGCYYGLDGIFLLQIKKNRFKNYLTGNRTSVRGIVPLGNQEILVNSYKGLYRLTGDSSRVIADFHGLGMYQEENGQIWTGVHFRSLIGIEPATNDYFAISIDQECFAPKISLVTQCFYKDKYGTLWIGTDSGLYFKAQETEVIHPWEGENYAILKTSSIRDFYENNEGLWLCTSEGLFNLNLESNHLINYDIFPVRDLVYLYEKDHNIFWIGSYNEGLIKWDRDSKEVIHYTREDGLVDNTIYAIYEDRLGMLWMPTNRGLMRLNPTTEDFITFHTSDGLPNEEFNTYSHYQDQDGNLYFGGINGFTLFHPDSLDMLQSPNLKPLIVSYAELSNETGQMVDQTSKFNRQQKIILNPSVKAFNLQFTNLDYANLKKQGYAYRINGFEKAWNYQEDNVIKVSGLPPGHYELEIKSQDSKQLDSDSLLIVEVVVQKPLSQSWVFRTLVILLIGLVFWGISRYRIYHLQQSKNRLEKEVELRTLQIEKDRVLIAKQVEALKTVNRTKDRLFAIIGHELRGPFVHFQNISGKLSYLLKKGAFKRAMQMGESMDQIAVKISVLLDNLLYWGLANSNRLPYQPCEVDISKVSTEIIDLYTDLAETKSICIKNEISESTIAYADPQAVRIVLRNLLGNAVKFTPEGGEVLLSKAINNGTVEIRVKDTGMGIDKEQIATLFDPKKMMTTEGTMGEKGTGLGISLCRLLVEKNGGGLTVESRVGVGSVFLLTLPRIPQN